MSEEERDMGAEKKAEIEEIQESISSEDGLEEKLEREDRIHKLMRELIELRHAGIL